MSVVVLGFWIIYKQTVMTRRKGAQFCVTEIIVKITIGQYVYRDLFL